MTQLKIIRRAVQLSAIGFFFLVPWLNAHEFYGLTGNLLSFTFFGVPLADPLAALQTFSATGTIAAKLLLGSLISVGVASLLGAVFCSWICPYGLISELNQALNRRVREPKYKKRASGFNGKLFIVGLILAAMALFGTSPILNQLSLPGWFTRAIQSWFLQGVIPIGAALVLVALAVDLLSGIRFWCRYCCPQSVILMLVQRFSSKRLRILFDKRCCTCAQDDSPCRNVCPLSLDPKGSQVDLEWECNNCGDCVCECTKHGGAITQRFAPKP
ncbi:MAG: 4Fe-4S binding protein [Pseudodesulfovibrio sp.]